MFLTVLASCYAAAQSNPCPDSITAPATMNTSECMSTAHIHNEALIDSGTCTGTGCPTYSDNNIISLYGTYGNNENNTIYQTTAQAHYQLGISLASNIKPRCHDGSIPTLQCTDGPPGTLPYNPSTVFLFVGFSNCDIEICGGNSDAWDGQGDSSSQTVNGHLPGQPCATQCPNLGNTNPNFTTIWNQVTHGTNGHMGGDNVVQQSLIYQVYSPSTPLVGSHVAVFDGAFGQQALDRWDPYDGFYASGGCTFAGTDADDSECNYERVKRDLLNNGFSENQVQAIFMKAADPFPECDLAHDTGCAPGEIADAYTAEQHLSDIMQYLRCCKLDENNISTGISRYPNLQQVFITSRTYGGYANGLTLPPAAGNANCLNPEPFAYELGFSIQRLIVGQIDEDANVTDTDPYRNGTIPNGSVKYSGTPNQLGGAIWFDWGPYLWANGTSPNSDGVFWCDSTTRTNTNCSGAQDLGDFRYGDLTPTFTQYFGDHIHPTAQGAQIVANELVCWITLGHTCTNLTLGVQSYITNWLPWITQ